KRSSNGLLAVVLVVLCTVGIVVYLARGTGGRVLESGSHGVELSEVMTSNKGAVPDTNGDFPDWVEIHNRTGSAVDISGYGLSDDLLSAAKWTFPDNTVIEAGGFVIVYCSGNADAGRMHTAFKLSASEEVILTTVNGTVIASVALRAVASGSSLGRDPNDTSIWREMRPSPGYPNTEEGAAAYLQTLSASAEESIGVFINEFMPSNASTIVAPDGSYADWIELYNTTGAAIDLSGYGISDNSSEPLKYTLPQGTAIEAYGTLLIYCTGRETPEGAEAPEPGYYQVCSG
ncbi:MAG: lamin tail domain-containing protein, partial [Clostridia bacterium]|nr:lamin tail domain-containing protein [Clostridia bacterium]